MSEATRQRGRPAAPDELLRAPPLQAVGRLATPTTAVMLVAATSNVLYTFYVSRLGADAIAAISLIFPISLLAIAAIGGGVGTGAASAIARALGAGRRAEAAALVEQSLWLGLLLGVGFAAGMFVGARSLFQLMGGHGVVLDCATRFARILFGGAAISFTVGMMDSVLRGQSNVRVPAIWSSASLLLQIGLTPLLMFVADLGLDGAPLAVLLSQGLALLPRLPHVLGRHAIVRPRLRAPRLVWAPLREILRVGVPASLSAVVNYGGVMVLTGIVARFGAPHLAAFGLGTRFDFLLLSFGFGVGTAVLTLVGMTTGAGRPRRAGVYAAYGGGMLAILLAVAGALVCWQPRVWLEIFTSDPEILQVGTAYLRIVGPTYPFVGIAMVLSFTFQGCGRATVPLVWVIVRVVGVVIAAIVCTQVLGFAYRAVFAVVAGSNVLAALVMLTLFVALQHRATASE
jgi:putative MATE family efflux protein